MNNRVDHTNVIWREYLDEDARTDPASTNYREYIVMYGGQENPQGGFRDSDYVSLMPEGFTSYISSDDDSDLEEQKNVHKSIGMPSP